MKNTIIFSFVIGLILGFTATGINAKAGTTLEKVSDTEVKITTTDIQDITLTLSELKKKKSDLETFKVQETNSCGQRIELYEAQIKELGSLIEKAEKKGVKDSE